MLIDMGNTLDTISKRQSTAEKYINTDKVECMELYKDGDGHEWGHLWVYLNGRPHHFIYKTYEEAKEMLDKIHAAISIKVYKVDSKGNIL